MNVHDKTYLYQNVLQQKEENKKLKKEEESTTWGQETYPVQFDDTETLIIWIPGLVALFLVFGYILIKRNDNDDD